VILSLRVLPRTQRRPGLKFDLLGGALMAVGVGSLLVAINRGASSGWDAPVVIIGLVTAPLWLAAFVWWERRTDSPLVDLTALRKRNVSLPLTAQLFLNGPYMAGLVITSLMLSAVFGYSTTAIALLILPRPIAFAIGAWAADRLARAIGSRTVVIIGGALIAGGLAVVGIGAAGETLALVIAGVVLTGAGSGIVRPPIIATLTEAVGDSDIGVGTGLLNMTGQIGAAAGISILSALVDDGSSPERFMVVFLIAAAIGAIAIVPGAAMRFPDQVHLERTPATPTAPYSSAIDVRRQARPADSRDRAADDENVENDEAQSA